MIPLILISKAGKSKDVKSERSAYPWVKAVAGKGLITRKEHEKGSWGNVLILDLSARSMQMLTLKKSINL